MHVFYLCFTIAISLVVCFSPNICCCWADLFVCSYYTWYLRLSSLRKHWHNVIMYRCICFPEHLCDTNVVINVTPPWLSLAECIYTHTWLSCLRLFSVSLLNCFHDYHLTLYAKQLIRKQSSVLIECSLKVMCVRGLVLVLLPPAAQLQVTLSGWRQEEPVQGN